MGSLYKRNGIWYADYFDRDNQRQRRSPRHAAVPPSCLKPCSTQSLQRASRGHEQSTIAG